MKKLKLKKPAVKKTTPKKRDLRTKAGKAWKAKQAEKAERVKARERETFLSALNMKVSGNWLSREALASLALDKGEGQTHYEGDACPGGHLPTGAPHIELLGVDGRSYHDGCCGESFGPAFHQQAKTWSDPAVRELVNKGLKAAEVAIHDEIPLTAETANKVADAVWASLDASEVKMPRPVTAPHAYSRVMV